VRSVAEWWEEMFDRSPWHDVQLMWESLEDTEQQIEQIVRATALEPGMRVLDVPCGTGRVSKRLAARGVDVLGVDLTDRFFDEARAAGVAVERADMRELRFDEEFDVAICMWGSFGYFDDEGNLAQARAACRALRPGGRYLIDVPGAESIFSRFRERDWFTAGDIDVLEHRSYAVGTGRIETDWIFVRGGERTVQRSSIRVYTVRELSDLLAEAGFTSFAALDDDLAPYAIGSRRLWMVATK
jgi:SAM-dependent methyltransferase